MLDRKDFFATVAADIRLLPRASVATLAQCDKRTVTLIAAAWVAALVLVYVAWTMAVSVAAVNVQALGASLFPMVPTVTQSRLIREEVESVAKTVSTKLDGITVKVTGDGSLEISAISPDTDTYVRWIAALSVIQGSADVRWSVSKLCAGECGNAVFTATLSGYRVSGFPR